MRRAVAAILVSLVSVVAASSVGASSARASKSPPPTFDRTVSEYVASWNGLQKALVGGTGSLVAVQRASGVFGNEVEPGVPIYLVARSRTAPIEAVVMPLKATDGSIQTPTKLLAASMVNLFGDITIENSILDTFRTVGLPALDHVPFKDPVTLADLVDLHGDVFGQTVVFTATPVGAKLPAVVRKLVKSNRS